MQFLDGEFHESVVSRSYDRATGTEKTMGGCVLRVQLSFAWTGFSKKNTHSKTMQEFPVVLFLKYFPILAEHWCYQANKSTISRAISRRWISWERCFGDVERCVGPCGRSAHLMLEGARAHSWSLIHYRKTQTRTDLLVDSGRYRDERGCGDCGCKAKLFLFPFSSQSGVWSQAGGRGKTRWFLQWFEGTADSESHMHTCFCFVLPLIVNLETVWNHTGGRDE